MAKKGSGLIDATSSCPPAPDVKAKPQKAVSFSQSMAYGENGVEGADLVRVPVSDRPKSFVSTSGAGKGKHVGPGEGHRQSISYGSAPK